jgi:hypothetical protein
MYLRCTYNQILDDTTQLEAFQFCVARKKNNSNVNRPIIIYLDDHEYLQMERNNLKRIFLILVTLKSWRESISRPIAPVSSFNLQCYGVGR